jgi:hypothetical protein
MDILARILASRKTGIEALDEAIDRKPQGDEGRQVLAGRLGLDGCPATEDGDCDEEDASTISSGAMASMYFLTAFSIPPSHHPDGAVPDWCRHIAVSQDDGTTLVTIP